MKSKSKKGEADEIFEWEKDPFFMVAPHLSLLNVHFVYRRLSPTSYKEIEVKIIHKLIHSDWKLTKSETEWIEKNLI